MTNKEVIEEWIKSNVGLFRIFCKGQSSCGTCILSECPLTDGCLDEWMKKEYKPRDDKH